MTVATLRTKATLEADLGFVTDLQTIKSTALFKIMQVIDGAGSLEEVRIFADRIYRDSFVQHQNALDAKNKIMKNIASTTYPDEDAE